MKPFEWRNLKLIECSTCVPVFLNYLLVSILTLLPSVGLLVVLAPRIHRVAGKGRLDGVSWSALLLLKLLAIAAAAGVQIGLLVTILGANSYRSSALLSTSLYLTAMVSFIIVVHS